MNFLVFKDYSRISLIYFEYVLVKISNHLGFLSVDVVASLTGCMCFYGNTWHHFMGVMWCIGEY